MAKNVAIRIDGGGGLQDLIKNAGAEMEAVAILAAKKAAHDTGLKVKNDLKKRSLAYGWKKYAKGWSMRTDETGITIYNRSMPGLTFLLEFGHDVIRNGVKVGNTKAYPHIKLAEEAGIAEFEEAVIREMERRLGS
ncbi:MAG: hypothetical protein IKU36_06175 [Bacteroidales bacterium]|nr:hypothetical protein [Bacteroidales bacterium]